MGVCQGKETIASSAPVEAVQEAPAKPDEEEHVAQLAAKEEPMVAEEAAPAPEEPPAKDALFTVCIVAARGIRNADWLPGTGKPDCYCELKIAGSEDSLFKTQVVKDALEPYWEEEVDVCDWEPGQKLEFSCYDEDGTSNDFLGKAVLDSAKFDNKGFNDELKMDKGPTSYIRVKVKMAGKAYPSGPPASFTVKVDRQPKQKTLGLDLDIADATYLYVKGVNAGPFQDYNKQASPLQQLKPTDFIVSCNGATGTSDAILAELKSAQSLELLVRRTAEMKVVVSRKPHGLEFGKLVGNYLLVTNVGDGPVADWNAANEGTCKVVQKNDRVVAVGALRGEAKQLQSRMKNATFQMTVARPADPETMPLWKS